MDAAGWLAPLGVAVLTATLLRRYRVRSRGPAKKTTADPVAAAREAVRETVGGWELRLHDAGRDAEAALQTRAAELESLLHRADAAIVEEPGDIIPLPTGEARVRMHLRQAGYDDGQIAVILDRDASGEERRAA